MTPADLFQFLILGIDELRKAVYVLAGAVALHACASLAAPLLSKRAGGRWRRRR